MVSDRPAQSAPHPAISMGRPASSHSIAVYVQSSRPSAWYAAVCKTGDREWAIGEPRTAAFSGSALPFVLPELGLVLLELSLAIGEQSLTGLRVDRHEVHPVTSGGLQRGLNRGGTWAVDRTWRQSSVLVRVVRGVAGQLLVGGGDAVRPETVEHRAVELELHALRQPVVDHPGDLRIVGQPAALGLDQAG